MSLSKRCRRQPLAVGKKDLFNEYRAACMCLAMLGMSDPNSRHHWASNTHSLLTSTQVIELL